MDNVMAAAAKRLAASKCEVRFIGTTENTTKAVISSTATGRKVCTGTADTKDNALAAAMNEFDKLNPEAKPPATPFELLEGQVADLLKRVRVLENDAEKSKKPAPPPEDPEGEKQPKPPKK